MNEMKDSGSKKQLKMTILTYMALLILITVCLTMYNNYLEESYKEESGKVLQELVNQQHFAMSTALSENMAILKILSQTLNYSGHHFDSSRRSVEMIEYKTVENDEKGFEYVYFIPLNVGFENQQNNMVVSDKESILAAFDGKDVVGSTGVLSDNINKFIFNLYTPVFDGETEEVLGALVAQFKIDDLKTIFFSSFDRSSYTYVLDSDINEIAKTTSYHSFDIEKNFSTSLSESKFISDTTYEKIADKILSKIEGDLTYVDINGVLKMASYKNIEGTDWTIFTVMRSSVLNSTIDNIVSEITKLSYIIIIIAITLIAFILTTQFKNNETFFKYVYYDTLTGLPNLKKFKLDVEVLLANNPDVEFGCFQLDIQKFKIVNELFGSEIGDEVIKSFTKVAKLLEESEGESKVAYARITSDEFIAILPTTKDFLSEEKRKFFISSMKRIIGSLCDYIVEFRVGRYVVQEGDTIDQIIERVNMAHRRAKEQNIETFIDYDVEYKNSLISQVEITNEMEEALKDEDFRVYLQGKHSLKTGKICGAEALVRWQHKSGNLIPPYVFIPEFEKNGFIVKLDFYMFENCCKIIRGWLDAGLTPVMISVNFSRQIFVDQTFPKTLKGIASKYNVPTKYLEVEITETVVLDHEEKLKAVLVELHEYGFHVSMDDFGTGYSSVDLLRKLDVDIIKLDRDFLYSMFESKRSYDVVDCVIKLAKSLDITTVAEGIEEKEQADKLNEIGCDIAQGFYFARPIPANELKID